MNKREFIISIIGILLALNSYFLKRLVDRIDQIESMQVDIAVMKEQLQNQKENEYGRCSSNRIRSEISK